MCYLSLKEVPYKPTYIQYAKVLESPAFLACLVPGTDSLISSRYSGSACNNSVVAVRLPKTVQPKVRHCHELTAVLLLNESRAAQVLKKIFLENRPYVTMVQVEGSKCSATRPPSAATKMERVKSILSSWRFWPSRQGTDTEHSAELRAVEDFNTNTKGSVSQSTSACIVTNLASFSCP